MINSAFSVPKEPLKSAFLAATYLYANNAVRKWEKNSSWYVRYVEWVLIEKDSSSLFRKKWNMGTQGSGLLRRIFYRTSIWREDDQMLSYLFKIPSFANFWRNSFLFHINLLFTFLILLSSVSLPQSTFTLRQTLIIYSLC